MTTWERIRGRLQSAGLPFKANDNVAAKVMDGDLPKLEMEVAAKVRELLDVLVIDVEGDHNTADTAGRVARMLVQEVMAGRFTPAPPATTFPNAKQLDQLLLVGPIAVRSMCSHHMVPIFGQAWVGVVPGDKVLGLSKFSRMARWVFARPQIQEEATVQLADAIEGLISPKGLGVVVRANHLCMTWRGVADASAQMTTSVMRGAFRDNAPARAELLALVGQ